LLNKSFFEWADDWLNVAGCGSTIFCIGTGRLTVDDDNLNVSRSSALLSVDEYRILSGVFMNSS
jgi:hypothetical protein